MNGIAYILLMVFGISCIIQNSFTQSKDPERIKMYLQHMRKLKSKDRGGKNFNSGLIEDDLLRKTFIRYLHIRAYTVYLTCYLYAYTIPKPKGEPEQVRKEDNYIGSQIPHTIGKECRTNAQKIYASLMSLRNFEFYNEMARYTRDWQFNYRGVKLSDACEMITALETIIISMHDRLTRGEANGHLFRTLFPDETNLAHILHSNHNELHARITIPYEMMDVKLYYYLKRHFGEFDTRQFLQNVTLVKAVEMWQENQNLSSEVAQLLSSRDYYDPETRHGVLGILLVQILKANDIQLTNIQRIIQENIQINPSASSSRVN